MVCECVVSIDNSNEWTNDTHILEHRTQPDWQSATKIERAQAREREEVCVRKCLFVHNKYGDNRCGKTVEQSMSN